jgi:hypothetical protein
LVSSPKLKTEGIKEMPIGKSDKVIFGIKNHKKYAGSFKNRQKLVYGVNIFIKMEFRIIQ